MRERQLSILHIDAECLPGHWIGGDYVSKRLTAVAWSWAGDETIEVYTHYDHSPEELAEMIAREITAADIVTGHYIRGFDLRLVNGNLLAGKMPPLGDVVTSDTKQDLLSSHGRSLSQKNLAAQLGLDEPKIDVTLRDWEGFNAREPGFKDKGIERVVGDVRQHKALRSALLAVGWLGPVKTWRPIAKGGGYRP